MGNNCNWAGNFHYRASAMQIPENYALHNLASLPHITVAGACATGAHGSGDRNGNLATVVHAMAIVRGDAGDGHVLPRQSGRAGGD